MSRCLMCLILVILCLRWEGAHMPREDLPGSEEIPGW